MNEIYIFVRSCFVHSSFVLQAGVTKRRKKKILRILKISIFSIHYSVQYKIAYHSTFKLSGQIVDQSP